MTHYLLVDKASNYTHAVEVTMYVVGDLAYYGMVLCKEGMSDKWCHLCQLSGREFSELVKGGDEWTVEKMKRSVEEYHEKIEEHKRGKQRQIQSQPKA